MRVEFDKRGAVVNTHPDDAETGEWYPDDTRLAVEDGRGRNLPHGPLRVSQRQADDWPERAARAWDGKQWAPTGRAPVEREADQARRRVREARIPAEPTLAELAALVRDIQTILADGDRTQQARAREPRR